MKIKRIISAILSGVMCAGLLTSCFVGDKTVITVDTYEVSEDMYEYIVLNAKTDIESQHGENVWSSDKAETAELEGEEIIRDYLAKSATVYSLAKEYGIDPESDEIKSEVEGSIAEMRNAFDSDEEFDEELDRLGMTDDVLYELVENSVLNDAVYVAVVEADEKSSAEDFFTELFDSDALIRVKQILAGGELGGTEEENLEKIEELYDRLEAGADFDTLAQEENDDLFMFQNSDGYYILRGTRDKSFEDAAFSLAVGEVSEIVKTEVGYTILKKYEKDPQYIEEHFAELTDEYYEGLFTAEFESKLAEILAGIDELPDGYDFKDME